MISVRHSDSSGRRGGTVLSAALLLGFPCYAGAQSGILELGDARIYYESAGQGMAVVFIHGGALNLREWDDQVAALAPRFRVVAFDRRGISGPHGRPRALRRRGSLWVRRYIEPDRSAPTTFEVFDASGRWLGAVHMPTGYTPTQISPELVVGIWKDADDVPHVRAYRLVRR